MEKLPVLIVDDHPEVATAMAALLRSRGQKSVVVDSGERAMEVIRSRPVKLILLDLQMPGMNGWEVLRLVRADRKFAGVPIILCSAIHSAQTEDDALDAGAQEFLSKSDAFERLPELIQSYEDVDGLNA